MEMEEGVSEDPIAQKHSAMIERLSNLHQTRLQQQTLSRDSDSNSSSPSFESTKSYLHQFSSSKHSIETELNRLHNDPDSKPHLKSHLEKVSLSISNLEKFVAENSYFLPNYEVRSSLKSISDLKEKLEISNSELLPKKKFAFKSKVKSTAKDQNNVLKSKEIETETTSTTTTTTNVRDSPGFRDKEGAILIKNFGDSEEGEFTLANLVSCEIRIIGKLRAIFIHKLKNCKVFVGPIMGSIHIEEVEDCLFMLASHQIRIHHAKKTDFYLRVRSRPIIEDSNGVRFAPYLLDYKGIENDLKECSLGEDTGNWGNVDDFRWLRAVQSPNWCVLPEEERVGTVYISEETPNENS